MNRRDTIIVSVLLNAAIIAVLLVMAVNTDEEIPDENPAKLDSEHISKLSEEKPSSTFSSTPSSLPDVDSISFESMLEYSPSSEDFLLLEEDAILIPEKPLKEKNREELPEMAEVRVVEITVKKGDSLDKIARANGTTIEAIKNINNLKSVNLSIGQHLKVPVGYKNSKGVTPKSVAKNVEASSTPVKSSTAEYYTIKSGDTPWKIAKQQHVSMEQILKLNQLNEEKARNLKVGDKIRIR